MLPVPRNDLHDQLVRDHQLLLFGCSQLDCGGGSGGEGGGGGDSLGHPPPSKRQKMNSLFEEDDWCAEWASPATSLLVTTSPTSDSSSSPLPEAAEAGTEDTLDLLEGFMDINFMDEALSSTDNCVDPLDLDGVLTAEPFTFLNDAAMQAMEEGEPVDSTDCLRSDIMWSSNIVDNWKNNKRRHDAAAELSERAAALSDDLTLDEAAVLADQVLKEWDASSNTDQDMESEDVDVVSDCDSLSSSASTISTTSTGNMGSIPAKPRSQPQPQLQQKQQMTKQQYQQSNRRANYIQAGRSLLRTNRLPQTSTTSTSTAKAAAPAPATSAKPKVVLTAVQKAIIYSLNYDHNYSVTSLSAAPSYNEAESNEPHEQEEQHRGLLTPTESSDEEAESCSRTSSRRSTKRKVAAAAKNVKRSRSGSFKFGFRIFMDPEEEERQRLAVGEEASGEDSDEDGNNVGNYTSGSCRTNAVLASRRTSKPRRTSALKNTHCPSPNKASDENRPSNHQLVSPSASRPPSTTVQSSQDKSQADLRNMHNHMERQRRVDLRKNFDYLKEQVPDLEGLEKASKLTILNKATSYVQTLLENEAVLLGERERVLARNAQAKARLHRLREHFQRRLGC